MNDVPLSTSPWLVPFSPLAPRIFAAARAQSVVVALNEAQRQIPGPVRFVEHSALAATEPYESFIARTGCVPTRDNLHDLFNGLVWLTYPQTKRRLNSLQAEQIALLGTSGPRGPLRDALTLFDENAAILRAPPELVDALRRREWHRLFLTQRNSWQAAQLVIFGHALMEKLTQPRKAITAHVWVTDDLSDAGVAATLTSSRLTAKSFLPLPVLGVPGWWEPNEEPGFYDDVQVFRPERSAARPQS